MIGITMEINDLTWQGHCWLFFSGGRYIVRTVVIVKQWVAAVQVVQVRFTEFRIDTSFIKFSLRCVLYTLTNCGQGLLN